VRPSAYPIDKTWQRGTGPCAVSSSLSPALRKLLDAHVESFEKLELLMFLRRSPGQRSTIGDLSLALDLGGDEVRAIVAALSAGGLVARAADGGIVLDPQRPEDRGVLDELARVYEEDKIVLVKAIAETAMDRLRNLAGRAFADAFVIRKKRGDDDR
jgi:DNA-binding transcriptional ArsR family regulator